MMNMFGDSAYILKYQDNTDKKQSVETSHCPHSGKSEAGFYTSNVWHALGLRAVANCRQQKYENL